jgi:hypothetical protein
MQTILPVELHLATLSLVQNASKAKLIIAVRAFQIGGINA